MDPFRVIRVTSSPRSRKTVESRKGTRSSCSLRSVVMAVEPALKRLRLVLCVCQPSQTGVNETVELLRVRSFLPEHIAAPSQPVKRRGEVIFRSDHPKFRLLEHPCYERVLRPGALGELGGCVHRGLTFDRRRASPSPGHRRFRRARAVLLRSPCPRPESAPRHRSYARADRKHTQNALLCLRE
jgi:hypothetical protein